MQLTIYFKCKFHCGKKIVQHWKIKIHNSVCLSYVRDHRHTDTLIISDIQPLHLLFLLHSLSFSFARRDASQHEWKKNTLDVINDFYDISPICVRDYCFCLNLVVHNDVKSLMKSRDRDLIIIKNFVIMHMIKRQGHQIGIANYDGREIKRFITDALFYDLTMKILNLHGCLLNYSSVTFKFCAFYIFFLKSCE